MSDISTLERDNDIYEILKEKMSKRNGKEFPSHAAGYSDILL